MGTGGHGKGTVTGTKALARHEGPVKKVVAEPGSRAEHTYAGRAVAEAESAMENAAGAAMDGGAEGLDALREARASLAGAAAALTTMPHMDSAREDLVRQFRAIGKQPTLETLQSQARKIHDLGMALRNTLIYRVRGVEFDEIHGAAGKNTLGTPGAGARYARRAATPARAAVAPLRAGAPGLDAYARSRLGMAIAAGKTERERNAEIARSLRMSKLRGGA